MSHFTLLSNLVIIDYTFLNYVFRIMSDGLFSDCAEDWIHLFDIIKPRCCQFVDLKIVLFVSTSELLSWEVVILHLVGSMPVMWKNSRGLRFYDIFYTVFWLQFTSTGSMLVIPIGFSSYSWIFLSNICEVLFGIIWLPRLFTAYVFVRLRVQSFKERLKIFKEMFHIITYFRFAATGLIVDQRSTSRWRCTIMS